MTNSDVVLIGLFLLVVALVARPLGRWIASVADDEGGADSFNRPSWLVTRLSGIERFLLRVAGNDGSPMTWKQYLVAALMFNAAGFVLMWSILMLQHVLPWNPQNVAPMSWHLALNTAVSFVTNTNWQAYSGEAALSYASQMLCCGVQNFVSAATGIAIFLAFTRSLKDNPSIGNFWRDMIRVTLWILVPMAAVAAILLMSQGVVQDFGSYVTATPAGATEQVVPLGPAASQIAIKQLGTNGGGFFGLNSAHPFENPTALSNLLECLMLIIIPAALPFTYARIIGKPRQAWPLFAAMSIIFIVGLCISVYAETQMQPIHNTAQSLEGKELRLGPAASALWTATTTVTSNGSVNAMHDSMMPVTGGVALLNMMLGEVIFGGVGSGMYGMLLFVMVGVFISGLMVGRTPEFLGRKIEAFEIKWAIVAILAPSVCILLGTAIAASTTTGTASLLNAGPHAISEILYAFTSASANNGSAFGGLTVNTVFYNVALSIAMLVGRFGVIIPVMMIAGSLGRKKIVPASAGTLPTDTALFTVLLICTILIVGALTFFPVLTLGPIVEHALLQAGISF